MIVKLRLKYLAPYLPYGLKFTNKFKYHSYILTSIDTHSSTIKLNCITNYRNNVKRSIKNLKDFKINLRPLSDLYKEIEHNGKRFIPIVEIAKRYDLNLSEEDGVYYNKGCIKWVEFFENPKNRDEQIECENYYTIEIVKSLDNNISLSNVWGNSLDIENFNDTQPVDYDIIQKLLEWHFDIFGLIEKGLAVSIKTLNSKLSI